MAIAGLAENLLISVIAFASLLLAGFAFLFYRRANRHGGNPHLKASIHSRGPTLIEFVIKNTGTGAAHEIEASWEVGDQTRTWVYPELMPGDSVNFPVLEEGGQWVLNSQKLKAYLEELDDSRLYFRAQCRDAVGMSRKYSESLNLISIISSREQVSEMWDKDPQKSVASDLSNLNREFGKFYREFRKFKRDFSWDIQYQKRLAIINELEKNSPQSLEELSVRTGLQDYDLRHYLPILSGHDIIEYDAEEEVARR